MNQKHYTLSKPESVKTPTPRVGRPAAGITYFTPSSTRKIRQEEALTRGMISEAISIALSLFMV